MANWLVWSLLSAVFAAATALLAKAGVSGINSNLATAIRTTIVLIFAWLLVTFTGGAQAMTHIPARSWIFLVLSGLATGLSWLCYFRAIQIGPVSKVAPIDKLGVVFVIAASAAILHERMTPATLAGGLLIATGALVLALS